MKSERIFNIFIFFDEGLAREYGVRHHRVDGSDEEKTAFLLARIHVDYVSARRFPLSRSFTPEQWIAAQRYGGVLSYFEEAFVEYRGGSTPVFCLTSVTDGAVRVDLTVDTGPFRGEQVTAQKGGGKMPDYLVYYVDGNSFRFMELIHDDYFKAIRALFNAQLFVSCVKLLMSCIDTLAFIEFGDAAGNFMRWLDTYIDLGSHEITSEELWEFRNSVIHMTNLNSRKIALGKVSPIMFYVSSLSEIPELGPELPKPFNLFGFIKTIEIGIEKWAESYNQDRDKLLTFIERYDLTISDSRMAWFASDGEQPSG